MTDDKLQMLREFTARSDEAIAAMTGGQMRIDNFRRLLAGEPEFGPVSLSNDQTDIAEHVIWDLVLQRRISPSLDRNYILLKYPSAESE